jgi:hypothetical protein
MVRATFRAPVSITDTVSSRRLATNRRAPSEESAIPLGLLPTAMRAATKFTEADKSLASRARSLTPARRTMPSNLSRSSTVTLSEPLVET